MVITAVFLLLVYCVMCFLSLITCRFDKNKFFKNPVYEGANPKLFSSQLEDSLTPEQQKFQKNKYDRIVVVPSQQPEGQKYDTLNRKELLPSEDIMYKYTYITAHNIIQALCLEITITFLSLSDTNVSFIRPFICSSQLYCMDTNR